jgi:hypothetical protein
MQITGHLVSIRNLPTYLNNYQLSTPINYVYLNSLDHTRYQYNCITNSHVTGHTIKNKKYCHRGKPIQGVPKLNGKTSGMDSSYRELKKKGYDNMGPEMYSYRVVRACIY